MNAILPFWGEYGGTLPAVRCAIEHAGCPVYVAALSPIGAGEFHSMVPYTFSEHIRQRLLEHCDGQCGNLHAHSIARWFVVREMIAKKHVALPVYVFDWDVLIFTNLLKSWIPFGADDYAVSIEVVNGKPYSTAPSYINRLEPLNAFCATVEWLLRTNAPVLDNSALDDMMVWSYTGKLFEWRVGNTAQIHNASVFDHHLMTQNGMFRLGDLGKRIEWVGGNPHFVHKDGRLIRANTLHCWGPFKNAENWLIQRSKITS